MYLSAVKTIAQAVRLPSSTLREGKYVLIADSEGVLAKRDVAIGWHDKEDVVITEGLNGGEQVIITSISIQYMVHPLK